MASLRELQLALLDAALDGSTSGAADLIVENGLTPARRLSIYGNNARETFLAALEAAFPVLVKLAGRDWFRQTGRNYMHRHPSRSGRLFFVGERFPAFLDFTLRGGNYHYFADVARLEWAYQEALVAADHPGFDLRALTAVSPQDYGNLLFELHPTLHLVESPFPILAIWKSNQERTDDTGTIDLAAGASRVLLIRRDDHVELRELALIDFRLLSAFASGKTLGEAADDALRADRDGDLSASLMRLVRLGALVDYRGDEGAVSSRFTKNRSA